MKDETVQADPFGSRFAAEVRDRAAWREPSRTAGCQQGQGVVVFIAVAGSAASGSCPRRSGIRLSSATQSVTTGLPFLKPDVQQLLRRRGVLEEAAARGPLDSGLQEGPCAAPVLRLAGKTAFDGPRRGRVAVVPSRPIGIPLEGEELGLRGRRTGSAEQAAAIRAVNAEEGNARRGSYRNTSSSARAAMRSDVEKPSVNRA